MRLAIALLAVLVYATPSKANGFWFFSYSSARWCAPGLLAVRQASFIRVNWGATGYSSCFRYGAVVPAYGVWWRGPCLCSPWGYGVPGVAMVVPVASPVFPLGPLTLPVAATVPSGSSAQSPGLTPVFPPSGDRRRAKLAVLQAVHRQDFEHRSGANSSFDPAPDGLPLPASQERSSWKTRHYPPET